MSLTNGLYIDRIQLNICRARKLMSVAELSMASGVKDSTIASIYGGAMVTCTVAGRLAKALGVDVAEIVDMERMKE